MRVEVLLNAKVVFEADFDSSTAVRRLREAIKDHLNLSTFQMYTRIFFTEVLMTDSWDLAFFRSIDTSFLKIEVKQTNDGEDILEEAVNCCTKRDSVNLLKLFGDLPMSRRELLLNKKIVNGWTLLHFCCSYNMEEFIVLNQEYFKEFNLETSDDWTPLLIATMNNYENIVKFLVGLPSVDINKSTDTKSTALHIACKLNLQKIVKILINNFVDTSIEDTTRKTALEYANDPIIHKDMVSHVRRLSLKQPKSNIIYEGLLWMGSSRFKRNKNVYLKVNFSEGVLDIYEMKDNKIDDKSPMLRIGLRIIEKVARVSQVDLFNKNYYFEIKYLSKRKLFFHISKSYRDEWIDALTMSIDENKQSPIFKETKPPSEPRIPEIDVNVTKDSFEYCELLGEGTYGTVVKVRSIETGAYYAIKEIPKSIIKKYNLELYVKRECNILEKLSHPFVISIRHVFQDEDNLNLVLDYCPLGDLEKVVRPTGLDENVVRFYIAECILAIEYIQTMNIMHRDLKPANILIDQSGHIKLTDFGLSKEVLKLKDQKATLLGTPLYIPPENIKRNTLTHTYDLYSLGVIMCELITGSTPYSDSDHNKLFKQKTSGKLNIPRYVSVEAAQLLENLLHKNPEKRPNIHQVKAYPFFRYVDWEKLLRKEYKPPLKLFEKKENKGKINVNYD